MHGVGVQKEGVVADVSIFEYLCVPVDEAIKNTMPTLDNKLRTVHTALRAL